MRALPTVTLLIAATLAPLPAAAEDDWARLLPDAYDGEIFSGAEMLPGSTEFLREGDQIVGHYAFTEPDGGQTEGRLQDCHSPAPFQLTCRWVDRYGGGVFQATFATTLQSFSGTWESDGLPRTRLPWWGKRRIGS